MSEIFKEEILQRITQKLLDIQMLRLIRNQPMWGYKIKKEMKELFNLKLRHGALYPTLNTLEKQGFLTSKKQQEGGRTRKIYKITRKGRLYLQAYYDILKEQIHDSDIKKNI
ncbi:MAG: PadR family transcriptional regulator [Thermoproteota archaeon]